MNKIMSLVCGALLLVLGLQHLALRRLQQRTTANAFRADSLAAALDTTRQVQDAALVAVGVLYGDSLHAVERRTLQQLPARDVLDIALDRAQIANQVLTAQVNQLLAVRQRGSAVAVDTTTDERSARFDLREPPYTVMAAVTLPGIGMDARMDSLRIALDSARLIIRQHCGAPVNGVRPATMLVVTPDWLHIRIDSTTQAPGACNPAPRRRWWHGRVSVGPGLFLSRGADGQLRAGTAPGIVVSLWRWP